MFKRILNFLQKILKNKSIPEALEEGKCNQRKKDKLFKKELKFNDGKEHEKLIQEILSGNEDITNQNETKEKMLEYIDILIKRLEKCQDDIDRIKSELRKKNS